MSKTWVSLVLIAGFLGTSCGFIGGESTEGQGSGESQETIAVRSQIADIWRQASSTRRERACVGYVSGEVLNGGSASDPQVIGEQLAEGSLGGFDQEVVTQEWRTLLDSVCSDTREDFAAAEKALTPGGEGCRMKFIVQPEQSLEELITAASCEVVRGRTGGREVLVSLCVPEPTTRARSFDIGPAGSRNPYPATTPRSKNSGLLEGCPRSTVSPTSQVSIWTFVIPLTIDQPLVVLTGKNLKKEYLRFTLGFGN